MDEFGVLEKDLNNIYDKYIYTMALENNQDVLDDIFEIYARSKPEELRKIIEKHFIPTLEQRKNNAEIPTPVKLVDDMINKLRDYDPEYFTHKNKTFEPCCGKGNFILAIFEKYFDGLSYIEDEIERCRTIIEECIYFCDIDDINVYITRDLLMCHALSKLGKDTWSDWNKVLTISEFKYNCYVGNTLAEYDKIISEWSIDGFNGIIGNPPYNNKQNNSGKKGGGDHLWNKFVTESLNKWLLKDGYLVYVHPPSWRKPESLNSKTKGLFKLLTNDNHMIYLEIHDLSDGKRVFNAGTRYDWYVVQNRYNPGEKSKIRDEKGLYYELDLMNWKFLPNYNYDIIRSILTTNDKKHAPIIYSRNNYGPEKKWVSDKENSEFKYKLIHTTPKKGPRYFWSSRNDKVDKDGGNKMFGIKKVIFGDSGINDVIIDIDGTLGMTQHAMAIKVKDLSEAKKIKNILESDKFNEILKAL